jgi:hypothetical protein
MTIEDLYNKLLDSVLLLKEYADSLNNDGVLEKLRRTYKDSYEAAVSFITGTSIIVSRMAKVIDSLHKYKKEPNVDNCEKLYVSFLELAYSIYPHIPKISFLSPAPTEFVEPIDITKRSKPFDRIIEFVEIANPLTIREVNKIINTIKETALLIASRISSECLEIAQSKEAEIKQKEHKTETKSPEVELEEPPLEEELYGLY